MDLYLARNELLGALVSAMPGRTYDCQQIVKSLEAFIDAKISQAVVATALRETPTGGFTIR